MKKKSRFGWRARANVRRSDAGVARSFRLYPKIAESQPPRGLGPRKDKNWDSGRDGGAAGGFARVTGATLGFGAWTRVTLEEQMQQRDSQRAPEGGRATVSLSAYYLPPAGNGAGPALVSDAVRRLEWGDALDFRRSLC